MRTIAECPANVGDLVVWSGRPVNNAQSQPWFVGIAHAIDEDGYVGMVNSRGRILETDEATNGRVWELIPLPILTSPEAISTALETTFASRGALAEHLRPYLVDGYKVVTAALYATRRALILRSRTPAPHPGDKEE